MNCHCKVCHCSYRQDNQSINDSSINGTLHKANHLINRNSNISSYSESSWSPKYPFNIDLIPKVIRKKSKCVECNQEVIIKYLEPSNKSIQTSTTPTTINTPASTPIIINQTYTKKVPSSTSPIVIRQITCHQQQCASKSPPVPYETVITIPSELLSSTNKSTPLKLVIEILPEIQPQNHQLNSQSQVQQPPNNAEIVERYLEYQNMNKQMIQNQKTNNKSPLCKPKNLILNWQKRDCAEIKTSIKNLGVESADPNEYAQKYGASLLSEPELPEIASTAKNEHGYLLAADFKSNYFNSLEGDVHALGMIDLDKEGLSEYKYLIEERLKNKTQS